MYQTLIFDGFLIVGVELKSIVILGHQTDLWHSLNIEEQKIVVVF